MSPRAGLAVAEAAKRLNVSPQRVRAMIADHQLEAEKLGDAWLVNPQSVARRARRQTGEPAPGRPLAPHNVWALLWLASHDPQLREIAESWISPWMRWYLLDRARREDWPALAPRLRSRAAIHRLRAHPSDVPRLEQEDSIVRTGVSAAQDYGLDVQAPGVLEAYVSEAKLPRLAGKYLLEPSESPNALLHVVADLWPFPAGARVAPPHLVALDLLDSGDQRSQRAAASFFAQGSRQP
jgi:excisionase family DNA binding protein